MPSVRSYFNLTLYRKHLTRFWPVWGLYTLIWFFVLPVNLIINSRASQYGAVSPAVRFADRTVLELLENFGLGMAVAFGLLCAMAVWSYLYHNRSAGLIHALPIRREGLFFTGFLAGVTFLIVPNVLIFFLTLGAEAMAGAVNVGALALWLAMQSMYCLFFFCFATFCGFITGHILALPAFFFIFNFLAIGILTLVESVLHNFVYGFAGLTDIWPAAQWLSPLYHIVYGVNVTSVRENNVVTGVILEGSSVMVVYTVIGLVLAALALLIYRRHQVEQAGEVVTAGWLRPVFKYGVAFCGALAFGCLLYTIFDSSLNDSAWGMLFFLLLCGFLSYLSAEMLLQKSFRVLKKSWKGCVVFLFILVVLTVAMELDFTGYEKRVPDPAEVESVTLNSFSSMPYDSGRNSVINASDAALAARIVSLHRSAVENKDAVEAELRESYNSNQTVAITDGIYEDSFNRVSFYLTYTLKNGYELSRSYNIPVTAELLDDPASPASLLLDILNHRENIAGSYFPADITAADFIEGSVSFFDETNGEYSEAELTAAEAGMIYEAAVEDLDAGGLGRRYLLEDKDYLTQVYQNEISLTFYGVFPEWTSETEPDSAYVSFYLQTDSVNLIAALREIGALNGGHRLMTQLEYLKAVKYMRD